MGHAFVAEIGTIGEIQFHLDSFVLLVIDFLYCLDFYGMVVSPCMFNLLLGLLRRICFYDFGPYQPIFFRWTTVLLLLPESHLIFHSR